MINVACVLSCVPSSRYSLLDVNRLYDGVLRHMPAGEQWRFLVYSDVATERCSTWIKTTPDGWWAKMALFDPSTRGGPPTLYLDLDTVVVGSLGPLVEFTKHNRGLGICENFWRRSGMTASSPCAYGSCVMTFGTGYGANVHRTYSEAAETWKKTCPHGDQQAIEQIADPNDVTFLQDAMPDGYFLHYTKLTERRDPRAALVCFGGQHKPTNTPFKWVSDEWKEEIK